MSPKSQHGRRPQPRALGWLAAGLALILSACAAPWEPLQGSVLNASDGAFDVELVYAGKRLRAFDEVDDRIKRTVYAERCENNPRRSSSVHRSGGHWGTVNRFEDRAVVLITFYCKERYVQWQGSTTVDGGAIDWGEACVKVELFEGFTTFVRASTLKGALAEAEQFCAAERASPSTLTK